MWLSLACAAALAPDELSCDELWSLARSPEASHGSHRVLDVRGSAPSSCASAAAMREFLLGTWPYLVLPRYWEAEVSDAAVSQLLATLSVEPFEASGERRSFGCEHSVPLCRKFHDEPLLAAVATAAKPSPQFPTMANAVSNPGASSGGGWHRDSQDHKTIKALAYLSDVGPGDAAFTVLMHEGRPGVAPNADPRGTRYDDDAVESHLREDARRYAVECHAPRGTVILFRTSVLHRGAQLLGSANGAPRLALTNYYHFAGVPASKARRVYVDLGVNWGNTLRLYEDMTPELRGADLPAVSKTPWQVFGFEASPLIAPYVERFVQWLNGEREKPPESCLPPTGSTPHLRMYASGYNCSRWSDRAMRRCMFRRLAPALDALTPDPALNRSKLIRERLDASLKASGRPRAHFTFVPAAVGAADDWMAMYNAPRQLIRGGSLMVGDRDADELDTSNDVLEHEPRYNFKVRVIDFVAWLKRSFTPADWVVVKMDIEGAEYPIFERLLNDTPTLHLIDVLALEVHPWGYTGTRFASPQHLNQLIEQAAPSMLLIPHHEWDRGFDSQSAPASEESIAQTARYCALKHHHKTKCLDAPQNCSRLEVADCGITVAHASRPDSYVTFNFDAANGPAASADFVDQTTESILGRLQDQSLTRDSVAAIHTSVRNEMESAREKCLQSARHSEAIETLAESACVLSINLDGRVQPIYFEAADSDEELASIARRWSAAAGNQDFAETVRTALEAKRQACQGASRQANRNVLGLHAQDESSEVTCAVVSTSGTLLAHDNGAAIDRNDVVVRLNFAPAGGARFERHVGAKTTMRFVPDSYLYLKTDDFGNAHDQIREENPESVVWIKDISELSYSAYRSVRPEFQRHHSYARFRSTNELWMRAHVENHCSGLRGRPPSSGFQTIALLATSGVCSAITLYGFCDPPDDQGAHVPYHYYEAVPEFMAGANTSGLFEHYDDRLSREKGHDFRLEHALLEAAGERGACTDGKIVLRDFARFEERMRCSPALPELPWLVGQADHSQAAAEDGTPCEVQVTV